MENAKVKTKKWIAVLAVFVLIAIVVTLVVVFLPKDSKKITRQTESQAQTMFLKVDGQQSKYNTFQSKINYALGGGYSQDTENVENIALSLNKIVEFYVYPLAFVEDGQYLQNNFQSVLNAYSKADAAQKRMVKEMEDAIQLLTGGDSTFFEGAWKNFKGYFCQYLSAYVDAIEGLSGIYQKCLPKGVYVNDFSILTVDTVNLYLQSIQQNLESNEAGVAQKIASKNTLLQKFLTYFDNNKIYNYIFDQDFQTKVAIVKTFDQIYGTNLKAVIDSAVEGGFSYAPTQEVQDTQGALGQATIFLKGELCQ